jgi:3-oxoacyl-[acyl-carrier-protein] synthase III
MTQPVVTFAGLGSCVPSRLVTNADFEKVLDTSDTWIQERSGIKQRYFAGPGETTSGMATDASRKALADAKLEGGDLDLVVGATASPDRLLPSMACDVQAALGAKNAAAFDVIAACPGWLYGVVVARSMIEAGTAHKALVVGAERLSCITDQTDRSTAVLLGDGAGATVLVKATGERGILSTHLRSDGTLAELLYRPGGGASHPPSEELLKDHSYYLKMAGREVFKAAVKAMSDAAHCALEMAGVTGEQIDLMVPHQANLRIITATAEHAHIPMEKVFTNVDRYGNTSAASIPLALVEARQAGRLQPGTLVLLVTFGAGFCWGAAVVRW